MTVSIEDVSSEDLLIEYRRLFDIEIAARRLVIGRLRDQPEFAMRELWDELIYAVNKDSLLGWNTPND